jgi:hypothetical protein
LRLLTLLILVAVLIVSVPGSAATPTACAGPVVMSFPLAAASAPEPVHLGRGLVLQAVTGDGGWELQVFKAGDTERRDNRLSPIQNWHGAQPFLVTPYMASIYPDERVISIRGTSASICVRILNGRIEGGGNDRRYVDGVVEVRWSGPRG